MKTTKILALALAALTMTACSDSDDFTWNTASDVTVEFGETQVSELENVGIFTIPVLLTGNPNGYVQITVECIEPSTDPAINGVHYYLTSDKININPVTKQGEVEFRTNDRRGLDPDRSFTVKISGVKGATLAGANQCYVQIVDKGSSPAFNALPGAWYMSGLRYNDATKDVDTEYFERINLTIADADQMMLTGDAMGEYPMFLKYLYDDEEKWGELAFVTNDYIGTYGPYLLKWDDGGSGNYLVGKWNSTYTAVTFGDATTTIQLMACTETGTTLGYLDIMSGFTLAKAQD